MTTPDSNSLAATRKAGRPRSVQSRQAILNATIELLAENGIEGMSIEAVAVRAGVGKTTIYRWWPSKEDLIIDTVNQMRTEAPIIDTGSLRGDLLILVGAFFSIITRNPLLQKLILRLIGEMKTNPEIFQAFQTSLIAPRIQMLVQMIERAKARGEIRQDLDPLFVLGLIMGPLIYQMLFTGTILSSPPPDRAEQLVDAIFRGIGA